MLSSHSLLPAESECSPSVSEAYRGVVTRSTINTCSILSRLGSLGFVETTGVTEAIDTFYSTCLLRKFETLAMQHPVRDLLVQGRSKCMKRVGMP
jgi:hypothetical protein